MRAYRNVLFRYITIAEGIRTKYSLFLFQKVKSEPLSLVKKVENNNYLGYNFTMSFPGLRIKLLKIICKELAKLSSQRSSSRDEASG